MGESLSLPNHYSICWLLCFHICFAPCHISHVWAIWAGRQLAYRHPVCYTYAAGSACKRQRKMLLKVPIGRRAARRCGNCDSAAGLWCCCCNTVCLLPLHPPAPVLHPHPVPACRNNELWQQCRSCLTLHLLPWLFACFSFWFAGPLRLPLLLADSSSSSSFDSNFSTRW